MMRRQASNPRKLAALQLSHQVGAAEASRRLGIPASTIRMWKSREAKAVTRAEVSTPGEAIGDERRVSVEQTADSAAKVARDGLASARRELRAGHPLGAQQAMVSAGIALDKLAILEQRIEQAQERQVRLTGDRSALLVAVFERYHAAIGLPFGESARRLLGKLLRSAEAGEPLVADPVDAEPAAAQLRRHVAREIGEAVERELRERIEPEWRAEHRALPAAGETGEASEPGVLGAPRTMIFTDTRADWR